MTIRIPYYPHCHFFACADSYLRPIILLWLNLGITQNNNGHAAHDMSVISINLKNMCCNRINTSRFERKHRIKYFIFLRQRSFHCPIENCIEINQDYNSIDLDLNPASYSY